MKQKFLFLITLVLVLVLPFHQAQAAGLGDILTSWIKTIVTGVIDVFSVPFAVGLMLIQAVTGILPVIAAEMFKVTLALNDTIALTPSSPNAQPTDMVVVGWNFTRDLANMFFVLIFAWVGLATILRLESYEVKKIIPKLIIIALLINFIPVITGVILDIASILTKYFADKSLNIGALLWEKLPATQIAREGTDGLLQLIPGQGGISGIAVKSLMGIVFNLIAFFMLELYAILFIIRIVAIWILIVLAPLAWLGYIIPQGKKMWDMWWRQFLQWAIIGIFLTFFLYLSGFVLGGSMDCNINEQAVNQEYGFSTAVLSAVLGENLICNTLPFIAAIVVMLIGFIMSITFAPLGADAVMKGAKKGGMVTGKMLGKQAWGGAKEAAKFPGQFKDTYTKARVRGLDRKEAFGHASKASLRYMRRNYRPALPLVPSIKTYKTARKLGMPRHDAIRAGLHRWNEMQAAGTKTSKAAQGIGDAIKAGLLAGVGVKRKKKKTGKDAKAEKRVPCPTCGRLIAESTDRCGGCGAKFEFE